MHPLNPYCESPPDFGELAKKDTRLEKYVKKKRDGTATIDFRDGEAVREIASATLQYDFGVYATFREDRLCPPIPNRLNYLAWVDELLSKTEASIVQSLTHPTRLETEKSSKRRKLDQDSTMGSVRIVDVGTGASCIYPILGCALHADWEFAASDIDSDSLESARHIITDPRNNSSLEKQPRLPAAKHTKSLAQRIHLFPRSDGQALLLNKKDLAPLQPISCSSRGDELLYHVSMCNPPFYESKEDMQRSLQEKSELPSAICHGSAGEMICEGGEVSFISRMITESADLSEQVLWFTSMVGKLASLRPLVDLLHTRNIENYVLTEFIQGRTRRWGIAWSYKAYRIAMPMVPASAMIRSLQPYKSQYSFTVPTGDILTLQGSLKKKLEEDGLRFAVVQQTENLASVLFYTFHVTWTRRARRQGVTETLAKDTLTDPVLVGRVFLENQPSKPRSNNNNSPTADDKQHGTHIQVTWVYGKDHAIFHSFTMAVIRTWVQSLM